MKNDLKTSHGVHLALAFKGAHLIAYKRSMSGRPKSLRKRLHCRYSSIHAEVALIQYLEHHRYKLNKLKIVVVRVKLRNNIITFHDSQPCLECARVLYEYNISSVFHSMQNGCVEKNFVNNILRHTLPSRGTRALIGM